MKPVKLLIIVALGATLLSAGCLGGAYTLAGASDSGRTDLITREIPWDGSASMSLGLPSIARYIQAPGPGRLTARGPHRVVSTLTISKGVVHDQLLRTGAVIEITLTAPDVSRFELNGASRLTIEAYDQDSLSLVTQGEASIEATGRTREVKLGAGGAGAVNLARLEADALTGHAVNDATVIARPTVRTDLDIANSATVILLTRPPEQKNRLTENGRTIDAARAN